jgi:hypothetical protein
MASPTTPPPTASVSLSDILTATKNVVTALNNAYQAYLNVQGQTSLADISKSTVVKKTAGRIATVSILTAGSTQGVIYDSNSGNKNPIFIIPNTVGFQFVNFPVSTGILVVPGTGQIVSISYS